MSATDSDPMEYYVTYRYDDTKVSGSQPPVVKTLNPFVKSIKRVRNKAKYEV